MSKSQKPGSARKRHEARLKRHNRPPMAVRKPELDDAQPPQGFKQWHLVLTSIFYEIRKHPTALIVIVIPLVIVVSFSLTDAFWRGRVPPNVFVLNTAIGGLQHDAAAQRLETLWSQEDVVIRFVEGNIDWIFLPTDLGIYLDTEATINATHGIGLSGIPFGYRTDPVISTNVTLLRRFLEELSNDVYIAPVNARYEWQDDTLIGISGQYGIQLDVDATLNNILESSFNILDEVIILTTSPLAPLTSNADVFLNVAQSYMTTPFELITYNPFENRHITFSLPPETIINWFEAGENTLVVQHNPVTNYVDILNNDIANGLPEDSFLNAEDVIVALNSALATGNYAANVPLQFYPSSYEVISGDTGFGISRKTGIPFFLIEQANPNLNLNVLSPGDIISLPARDVTLPQPVVPNKRIIVNLETQMLVAFENGQVIFNWLISSGVAEAPTSPGIYQIFSHEEVAYGSSYTLCDDAGCGQWELNWFMGIYEVVPGLVNGFHGAVLLPNGGYLGGNNVGAPYTLGCVMSRDDQAQQLYDWADIGTIVEIISSEFPPQSELARIVTDP